MRARARFFSSIFALGVLTAGPAAAQPVVISTAPTANASAAANTTISVTFDEPILPSTINSTSFRVFGKQSGTAAGAFSFSNSDQTVMFTPAEPFAAGEFVLVNLSESITAPDLSPLPTGGYAFQLLIEAQPSGMVFSEIQEFSNRNPPSAQTRIYGAMVADLNEDDFTDLMTVNEVSADVRVFLNLADGSGLVDENFLSPQPIGVESSPNESGDFDNDGNIDAAISATSDQLVSILLGNGDGTFGTTELVGVSAEPHGIAVLDVDGDADLDIVSASRGGDELGLLINDGTGNFASPILFDSCVTGEYGLTAGDMDGDGIADLVVGGIDSQEICTMLGNGDGTFTPTVAQDSGGLTWVIVLGDVDGDGDLDAASANSTSGNVAISINNGAGLFALPDTIAVGFHVPSVDLGDLDGDDDADLLLSSFGGGFWRLYLNDGAGSYTFQEETTAISSPSCAAIYDADNDGDLDVALTDEIADVVKIMLNTDGGTLCPPVPDTCRPAPTGKSSFSLKDNGDSTKDRLSWKWTKGQATPKPDFGDPASNGGTDYELCIYENNLLIMDRDAPAGGICASKPCWKEKATGFFYKDKALSPDGIAGIKLGAGGPGAAKIGVKGSGVQIAIPAPISISGTLDVQLHAENGICWGATFSQPFLKQDGSQLKAKSD